MIEITNLFYLQLLIVYLFIYLSVYLFVYLHIYSKIHFNCYLTQHLQILEEVVANYCAALEDFQ